MGGFGRGRCEVRRGLFFTNTKSKAAVRQPCLLYYLNRLRLIQSGFLRVSISSRRSEAAGSVLNDFDSADLLLNSRAVVHVCGNGSYLINNFDTVRYPAESGILTVEKISGGMHDKELA